MDRSFLDAIPSGLRWEPPILPDARNAFIPWQKLPRLVYEFNSDEEPFRSILHRGWDPEDVLWQPISSPDYESPRLRQVFDANVAALACLEEGLALGELRLVSPSSHANDSLVFALVKLAQLLAMRALSEVARGNIQAADSDIRRILAMGRFVLRGSGDETMGLVGLVLFGIGTQRLSADAESGSSFALNGLLMDTLPRRPELLSAGINCVKVDLRDFATRLMSECVASCDPYDPLAVHRAMWDEPGTESSTSARKQEQKSSTLGEEMKELVRGHPNPFDRHATLAQMVAAARAAIRCMRHELSESRVGLAHRILRRIDHFRQARHKRAMSAWPGSIVVRASLGEENYRELLAIDDESLRKHLLQPGYPVYEAQRRLRRIDNPIGVFVLDSFRPTGRYYAMAAQRVLNEVAECQRLAQVAAA